MLKANLWCPDCTCGKSGKERDFKLEVEKDTDKSLNKTKCPNDNKITLKHMGFSSLAIGVVDVSKKFNGRSPKEREQRRTGDFIKNTLPTLPDQDRMHFQKKFNVDKDGKKLKKK